MCIRDRAMRASGRTDETKSATEDSVYITNANNVKGLEFPFVICITKKILGQHKYRNSLYTCLLYTSIQLCLKGHLKNV